MSNTTKAKTLSKKKIHPIILLYKKATSPVMMVILGLSIASVLFLFAEGTTSPTLWITEQSRGWLYLTAAISPAAYILLLASNIKQMFYKKK